jgi:hypothetical protein
LLSCFLAFLRGFDVQSRIYLLEKKLIRAPAINNAMPPIIIGTIPTTHPVIRTPSPAQKRTPPPILIHVDARMWWKKSRRATTSLFSKGAAQN